VNQRTTCIFETRLARLHPHSKDFFPGADRKGGIKTGNINCKVIPTQTKNGNIKYRLSSECDHCHRPKSTWLKSTISGGKIE